MKILGKIWRSAKNLGADSRAATAIEYGLIAALIAVAAIAAMTALGESLSSLFNDVSGELEKAEETTATEDPPQGTHP